jgi:hypothetical protein
LEGELRKGNEIRQIVMLIIEMGENEGKGAIKTAGGTPPPFLKGAL